jgi:alkylation response protein AidB-like acyl-CoA dehydrogenase
VGPWDATALRPAAKVGYSFIDVVVARDTTDAYREHVHSWLSTHSPTGWREQLATSPEDQVVDFYRNWARKLHAAGLLVPHWPVRFGGEGKGLTEQVIIQQELSYSQSPRPRTMAIALGHAAATLMDHGSPEQQRLIAGILDGDVWCQGFSEPQAGSDLASLRTTALRHGDVYLVNGQKTWSSFAAHAAFCLLLARTDLDAPKHRGLSLFVMDMSLPGVMVRRIQQATGSFEFAEIFLGDVKIPVAWRLGEEGDGWRMAQTTLSSERVVQLVELIEGLRAAVRAMADEALVRVTHLGQPWGRSERFRTDLARVAMDVEVLSAMTTRAMGNVIANASLGASGSTLKLFFSELLQRASQIGARMSGLAGLRDPGEPRDVGYTSGEWFTDHLRSWTWTIAAGSDEIQRNIISERVLGLPREVAGS